MQGQYNEPFFQFDLKRMYNITVIHCICFIKEMSCQIDLIPLWSISRMVTITFIPSAAIGADGYCRRSLRPAVCPSVRLSVISLSSTIIIPWNRSLYKMAMLGHFLRVPRNFEIVHDMIFTRSEGGPYHSNSFEDFRCQPEMLWGDAQ